MVQAKAHTRLHTVELCCQTRCGGSGVRIPTKRMQREVCRQQSWKYVLRLDFGPAELIPFFDLPRAARKNKINKTKPRKSSDDAESARVID